MIPQNDVSVNIKCAIVSLLEKTYQNTPRNLTRPLLLKIAISLHNTSAAKIGRDLEPQISRQYVNNFIRGDRKFYREDIAAVFIGWGIPKEIVWPFETPKKKAA